MLLEFSVGNYSSFKEISTLSLVASGKQELEDTNIFEIRKGLYATKSAVIYGANASGKSNFFNAMFFMTKFIVNSFKETQIGERIDVKPFLMNAETKDKASYFEIILSIGKNAIYQYGFEVTSNEVVREWLYEKKLTVDKVIFKREKKKIDGHPKFLTEIKKYPFEIRDNALYLSALSMYGNHIAENIVKYIMDKFIFIDDVFSRIGNGIMISAPDSTESNSEHMLAFLKAADINIKSFTEEEKEIVLQGKKRKFKDVFFKYNVYDKENEVIGEIDMSLDLESQGTKKLFIIAEFIVSALMQGKIVIIDEFNNSLHPAITKFIMQSFNSVDINKENAQLVVNTHDTNLLDNKLVRRDQIWFVTKNKFGESELFSLLEYDGVRSDALYEKNYLLGKYGAVPYIDLDALLSLWVTGEDNGN